MIKDSKVALKSHPDLSNFVDAVRMCYKSEGKSDSYRVYYDLKDKGNIRVGDIIELGEKDKTLCRRILDLGHESTVEHLYYTFIISGISRACLQELARHRIASLSVQSTRYCLKRLLDGDCEDVLVATGNEKVDELVKRHLQELVELIEKESINNDFAKYAIPEAFATELQWTINARSLRNFLKLRTSKRALWEIRSLAYNIYNVLPEWHRFLFEDVMGS
jgi:thymidylate synthase (FAD)